MTKKLELLIVDDNQSLTYNIEDAFKTSKIFKVVGSAHDGEEAICLIEKLMPDVVILDIIMPKVDGLEVLKKFSDQVNFDFVVISALGHENITRKAIELGAMYYLIKPFDPHELKLKLEELFTGISLPSNNKILTEPTIDDSLYFKSIEKELNTLGVPMHVKGFHYLYQGIYYMVKINSDDFKITKDLYPWLANEFKTSPASVEKSIRSTIELTIMRGNIDKLKRYFSNDLFNDKITNKAFMIKIASEIKKMMN